MKKIVVASDSFKGSVSSIEVAECAELAIHKVFPDCEVVKIPVGDGGEGTVETLITAMGGEAVSCVVHDPLMRSVEATYGILGDNRTAVIEMATASGLTLVPVSERNPLRTTTYGTGELIKDAMDRGCRDFLIGIGGSATNDGGTGMLQALGFRFLDRKGNELGLGGQILNQIYEIDCSRALSQLRETSFTIACDVNNPFYGEKGADLIITGEGKLDKQTCMGKTPCGVLQAGMRQGIPVIVMGGSVEEVEALNKSGFLAVLPLLPYPVSLEQAMDKDFTCRNIGRALEQQLRVIHYYMNH